MCPGHGRKQINQEGRPSLNKGFEHLRRNERILEDVRNTMCIIPRHGV